MVEETVQKCLSFAEGTGKHFSKAKCENFPESLIKDDKQLEITRLRKDGLSLREIAGVMGFSNVKTVAEHLKKYEEKQAFYEEWKSFNACISAIKDLPFEVVADGALTERQKNSYSSKGVVTVGDYLDMAVKMSVREMQILLGDTSPSYKLRREKIFLNIRELLNNT